MSILFDDIERQTRQLSVSEKALLARILVEEIDPSEDRDVEQLWITESQRRYEGYLNATIEAQPGDEVMARVRRRLQ